MTWYPTILLNLFINFSSFSVDPTGFSCHLWIRTVLPYPFQSRWFSSLFSSPPHQLITPAGSLKCWKEVARAMSLSCSWFRRKAGSLFTVKYVCNSCFKCSFSSWESPLPSLQSFLKQGKDVDFCHMFCPCLLGWTNFFS